MLGIGVEGRGKGISHGVDEESEGGFEDGLAVACNVPGCTDSGYDIVPGKDVLPGKRLSREYCGELTCGFVLRWVEGVIALRSYTELDGHALDRPLVVHDNHLP